MAPRRVLYSVLFGSYEALLEQPGVANSGMDRILFTDKADLRSDTWQVCRVDPRFPADPVRSARRVKILAHEYVADYDESLYIDNTVQLTVRPEELFVEMAPPELDPSFAIARHSFRGPVHEEFEAVLRDGLDNPWRCDEQEKDYASTDPDSLDAPTLHTNIMVRHHHDPLVRETMALWWEHVCRYSRRDQLSLVAVLRQTGLEPHVLPWDQHHSPFYRWPVWVEGTTRTRRIPYDPASTRIGELESTLGELELELGHSRIRADALDDGLAQARAHTGQLEWSQAQLSARNEDLAAQLVQAESRYEATEIARQQTAAALEEHRRSRWWRVTAPLRAAADRIKR
jgi:hypothetical protein